MVSVNSVFATGEFSLFCARLDEIMYLIIHRVRIKVDVRSQIRKKQEANFPTPNCSLTKIDVFEKSIVYKHCRGLYLNV